MSGAKRDFVSNINVPFFLTHHLQIGLLDEYKDSPEDNVNALLHEALDRIASLPHSLLVDKWRWDLFSGTVNQTQWNEHWWDLVQSHQKISKPVPRSELDFDAGAKYQVAAGTQYIRYEFIIHSR